MSVPRLSFVVALGILFSACSHLPAEDPVAEAPVATPTGHDELLRSAEDRAASGRWSVAIDMLESALQETPQDPRLKASLARMETRWSVQEQLWEDRMLLGDAKNLESRIEILEQLSRAAPNDLLVASRRLYWKEVLRGKADSLAGCVERHAQSEPDLARRCYRLATDLAEGKEMEQRLMAVREQLEASEQLAEQQRLRRAEKQRQVEATALLDEATAAIEASDYRRALDLLEQVEELQPDNPEVEALQQSAWSMLSPQIEALVKLGDHLYLDEQLNAAVATWQAAQNLKPDDADIAARLVRARTVLQRLDDLRDKQDAPLRAE